MVSTTIIVPEMFQQRILYFERITMLYDELYGEPIRQNVQEIELLRHERIDFPFLLQALQNTVLEAQDGKITAGEMLQLHQQITKIQFLGDYFRFDENGYHAEIHDKFEFLDSSRDIDFEIYRTQRDTLPYFIWRAENYMVENLLSGGHYYDSRDREIGEIYDGEKMRTFGLRIIKTKDQINRFNSVIDCSDADTQFSFDYCYDFLEGFMGHTHLFYKEGKPIVIYGHDLVEQEFKGKEEQITIQRVTEILQMDGVTPQLIEDIINNSNLSVEHKRDIGCK